MFIKKMLLIILIIAVSCGKNENQKNIQSINHNSSNTITVWHYWTEAHPVLTKLAEEFSKENNCRVDVRLFSSIGDVYKKKIDEAVKDRKLPDIIGVPGAGIFLKDYVINGVLRELTYDIRQDNWGEKFYPESLHAFRYFKGNPFGIEGGTLWAIPLTQMNLVVYYNKSIFKKYNLKVPENIEQLISTSKKLKADGIYPFVSGFGEDWMLEYFIKTYLFSYLGTDGMRSLINGVINYDDKDVVNGLQDIKKMQKDVLNYPRFAELQNKRAEYTFSHNLAAMAFNGSWAYKVYKEMNPNIDIGFFKLPVSEKAAHKGYVPGGIAKGLSVTRNGNIQLALKFIKYLTSDKIENEFCNELIEIPAVKNIDIQSPVLKKFIEINNKLIPFNNPDELPGVRKEIISQVRKMINYETDIETLVPQICDTKKRLNNDKNKTF